VIAVSVLTDLAVRAVEWLIMLVATAALWLAGRAEFRDRRR
jgi:hypothetical protein